MDQKTIEVIKKAGEIALDEQKLLSINLKQDKSIVTNGDLIVSNFLETELKKLYPDYEIFSEENTVNKPKGSKVIVLDPIDGTQSYSRKENTWSVLVGFLENGVAIRGFVYQPTENILYYGEKNKGSFMVEKNKTVRLSVKNDRKFLSGITSPTEYGEQNFLKQNKIDQIDFMYSASLKIMEVAKGNFDLYPNFRKKCSLWDLIAPQIILEEAGGQLVFEKNIKYNFDKTWIDSNFYASGEKFFNKNLFTE